ncbi:hypothetical protein CUMW_125790 [Citrus unshiu]|nr:hypothetical protein CUMW_125790 [Citrus unshiu]
MERAIWRIRVSMVDWTAGSERSVTSRHVAERLRSDRVRGFDDEEEVEAPLAAAVVVVVAAKKSCLRVSRMAWSGLRIFLKGSSDSSSDVGSGRRRFCFSFLSAIAGNECASHTDRIVLKDKTTLRPFASLSTVRKSTITVKILSLIHQLCLRNIHVTKRDLFYTDVKLFQDQTQSDAVLDDVACILGCTRSSLNVIAAEKGVVVGRLIFSDNGDMIDCTKMGMGGKAIPPNIDRVGDMKSDAMFILLVEKDAAYIRLAEDRFYNRFPCIIVTAKGQPDVATRLFLRKMKMELKLPVLALVDSDPYGLKILSVYGCGSKNMSYDSANLTTPDIKWLGIRPSDLDKYKIPEQCRLPMTEQDIKTGKDLLEEDFVKKNPGWVEELNLMVKTKQKAEIQALSSFGFQYLSEVYLPLKLQQKDWL